MGFDEQSRHDLHLRLAEVIGEEAASALMSSLPPDRWDSLAKKADLAELRQLTKADLAELRQLTKADLAELRQLTKADLDELRDETKADLAEHRRQTKVDLAASRELVDTRLESLKFELLAAFHAEIGNALTAQTRVTVFTMAGSLVGLAGLAMAFERFG